MEFCMEARALKSSLRRELAAKATQQHVLLDDYRCVAGVFGAPATEDFSVDDLLDLSGGEFEVEVEEEKDLVSVSSREVTDEDENLNFGGLGSGAGAGDSDSFLSDELVVPEDDIAELEWLSQFVDDSIPEPSLLCPVSSAGSENRTEPGLRPSSVNFPYFPLPVPVKARTKRRRPAGRAWSLGTNSFTDSSSSTSSCSSGSTGVSTEPAIKKHRKKPAVEDGETGQFARRCSHCLVQKTPQWRTGPQGPKTLCNACGVRFKSGRLLPEYRPACSPTFSREVHSNSHRKVMEMRKRKDAVGPESGSVQMVASF